LHASVTQLTVPAATLQQRYDRLAAIRTPLFSAAIYFTDALAADIAVQVEELDKGIGTIMANLRGIVNDEYLRQTGG
jgi:hypothetical protein